MAASGEDQSPAGRRVGAVAEDGRRERSKNRGGLKNQIRRRLVCLCDGAAGEDKETAGGGIPQMGGGDIVRAPAHLVIMVNGIIGRYRRLPP